MQSISTVGERRMTMTEERKKIDYEKAFNALAEAVLRLKGKKGPEFTDELGLFLKGGIVRKDGVAEARSKSKTKRRIEKDRYATEETKSNYGYLSGYEPKSIAEQVQTLHYLFPVIKNATYDESIASQPLPPNAEGWFAIPWWEKIVADIPAGRQVYGEAVQRVLDLISETRNGEFHNYREGQLGPSYLRQFRKSIRAWKKIRQEQKDHDILIIPAQFGLCHAGRSIRRARVVMNRSEFGLGAFAVGIMLLTHPERLMNYNDLWIDCAGDEYAPDADGVFSESPIFLFHDDKVKFHTRWVSRALDGYGSASGFLLQ
jgi:hypothetical protein